MPRAAEADGQTYPLSHRAGRDEGFPPVHIVGCRQSLDRRPDSGRPRLAPHSLLQEYLNRTEHLWGILANGNTLRVLVRKDLAEPESSIRTAIANAGLLLTECRISEPSLEDVFVAATRARKKR